MEDKLRAYMDHLFREVTPTKKSVEVKEEILQNLKDKYHDLLAEGKTEEAAYNIAVASIGDVSELLASLKEESSGNYNDAGESTYLYWKRRSARAVSIAVILYILSILPPIITDALNLSDAIGACLMFIFIAVATGILVYNHMSKPALYNKKDDTMMEDFKEWKSKNESSRQAMKSIISATWSITLVLYFVISFGSGAWYITWVIFLIGGAITSIIKAVFDLMK